MSQGIRPSALFSLFQVGYGRGTPTNTIWCGNLAQNITEGQLQRQFHQFGYVTRVMIDRQYWQALTSFDTIDAASFAFADMHGRFVLGKRLMVSCYKQQPFSQCTEVWQNTAG